MNNWLEFRDIGYVIMWAIMGLILIAWIVGEIKENAFQSGYWKGRSDGWKVANRHRDLTDANNN